jgi:hypothetical protein
MIPIDAFLMAFFQFLNFQSSHAAVSICIPPKITTNIAANANNQRAQLMSLCIVSTVLFVASS